MGNRDNLLCNNGTFIQLIGDEMGSGANQFYASLVRLFIWACTNKGR